MNNATMQQWANDKIQDLTITDLILTDQVTSHSVSDPVIFVIRHCQVLQFQSTFFGVTGTLLRTANLNFM